MGADAGAIEAGLGQAGPDIRLLPAASDALLDAFAEVDLILFGLDASGRPRDQLIDLRLALPEVPIIPLLTSPDPELERALAKVGLTACLLRAQIEGPDVGRLLRQTHRLLQLETGFEARSRALVESEERFRNLVDASADGFLVIDHDGIIAFANPAAAAMFGRPLADLLSSEFGHPMAGASTTEIEVLGPDRTLGVAEMRIVPHQWRGARAFLALLRDVTRFKEAEARLRANGLEIEARNRELEDLAVIVSHDLQEPLRKIRLFGRRLADRCGAALDDDGKVALGHMLNAAERMRGLLMDLLDLTRVSAHEPAFVEVDLAKLADEVTHDLAAAVCEAAAEIEAHDLPRVRGEPAHLRLVLQNLLANALKYRRHGMPPRICIEGASAEPGTRAFAVTDNGIGFEQAQAERIFAPFQRLHPAHVYGGTGMGLAICRKVIERHHGRIEAFGQPGQGARFLVTLPLQPEGAL